MHRRNLLAGLIGTAFSGTALRAQTAVNPETQVELPKITVWTRPQTVERKHLKGFWQAMRKARVNDYDATNASVRAAGEQYLEAHGLKLPVTFVGKEPRADDPNQVLHITVHEFVDLKRDDGCRELKVWVSCPQIKHDIESPLLNIECPPA